MNAMENMGMGDVIEGVFVSGRHGVGKASPRKLETRVVTP